MPGTKAVHLVPWTLSVASLSCQPGGSAGSKREAAAVRSANDRAVEALQQHQVDAAMELYVDDAVLQLPGMPPLSGKHAIRAFYAAGSDTSTVFEAMPTMVEVAASGELAYLVGTKREVCKSAAGQIATEGKVLIVWKKIKADWKIQVLSASNNSPTARGCL